MYLLQILLGLVKSINSSYDASYLAWNINTVHISAGGSKTNELRLAHCPGYLNKMILIKRKII